MGDVSMALRSCGMLRHVTCRGLVLLSRLGSWCDRSIIISLRGDLDSTGSCSQVVRLFSTVQGQIPRDGSRALPGDGLAKARKEITART